jgi:formylglycine-generating enzyme required for sulfatase activity
MVSRVLIENLAPNKTVSDIKNLLRAYEPVVWIFIELDANTKQPWGYAYFALSNDEQARAIVSASLQETLDKGNDNLPLRLRRVESGPDSYIDKSSLLNSPDEYIYSESCLVINNIPTNSTVLINNIVKARIDESPQVKIHNLLPGKYHLVVKNASDTIYNHDVSILPIETTTIILDKEERSTIPAPFETSLSKETTEKSNRKFFIVAFILLFAILSVVGFYYFSSTSNETVTLSKLTPPTPPSGMVYVSAQRFVMGRNTSKDPLGFEIPAHVSEVKLDFFIDRTEVTNQQYAEFVSATKHEAPPHWKGNKPSKDILDLPVVHVSWQDAEDYCEWRKNNKRSCRLPQEDEWELAARGPNSYVYPWGNEWKEGLANANKKGTSLVAVGKNPANASPFGAVDMVGNAWEWVYNDLIIYELSKAPPQPGVKVIRGGAFDSDPEEATGSFRGFLRPNSREYDRTGFRCVCDMVKGGN